MGRKIEVISEGKNYLAGNLGDLSADRLVEYEVTNPATGKPFPGKVFLAENLKTTGMEVSFQVMPPKMGMPFFHKHRKNEEMYIVLKGVGEFQVDDQVIPIREGSVVRVSPDGARSWKNTGAEAMVVICIQALGGTLKEFTGHDGYLT